MCRIGERLLLQGVRWFCMCVKRDNYEFEGDVDRVAASGESFEKSTLERTGEGN